MKLKQLIYCKKIWFISMISLSAVLLSFDLPEGWVKAGSDPGSYEMGKDLIDGRHAATLKSARKKIRGFGTLMQTALPGKYAGKRVRMSGLIKSSDVKAWAGMWFRVDRLNTGRSYAFDNMHDRSIKGTTDWKKYEIVLEVPEHASLLAYGVLLSGTGQVWFDDITFEIVDNTIPLTGNNSSPDMDTEPKNLDFEK